MSFWVILDDSIQFDELLAGAGAAALAALLAELALHQSAMVVRLRIEWLGRAATLPWQLVRDTALIYLALWKRLPRGTEPASRFLELPVRYGSDSAEAKTRRSLLVGGLSVAPGRFVLGLDRDREVMVVHELVAADAKAGD